MVPLHIITVVPKVASMLVVHILGIAFIGVSIAEVVIAMIAV